MIEPYTVHSACLVSSVQYIKGCNIMTNRKIHRSFPILLSGVSDFTLFMF